MNIYLTDTYSSRYLIRFWNLSFSSPCLRRSISNWSCKFLASRRIFCASTAASFSWHFSNSDVRALEPLRSSSKATILLCCDSILDFKAFMMSVFESLTSTYFILCELSRCVGLLHSLPVVHVSGVSDGQYFVRRRLGQDGVRQHLFGSAPLRWKIYIQPCIYRKF